MGLHLITSNGELYKQISSGYYDRKAGVNFYPGDKFQTLESYSNKEITERRGELFHSLLTRKRSNTGFIPNVGKGEWWERDNDFLEDEGRGW